MIRNRTKLYALSLALFMHLPPTFAMETQYSRFGPTNFEINCNDQPIRQIRYRSGAWLDYLELLTYKGDKYVSLGQAGNPMTEAKETIITFREGERLIGISGKFGSLLDSLTFLTNERNIGGFTGFFPWLSREFNYSRGSDDQDVFSIFGRTTTHLGYHIISEIGIVFRNSNSPLPYNDDNINASSIATQIIQNNQIVDSCILLLLKSYPQLFCPWILNSNISIAMQEEFTPDKLRFNFPIHQHAEIGIPVANYIHENFERELGTQIITKGRDTFRKFTIGIGTIQNLNFWQNSKTVSELVANLNEGNDGKEWVLGWNSLSSDYRRYLAASVIYSFDNGRDPIKFGDIESLLK